MELEDLAVEYHLTGNNTHYSAIYQELFPTMMAIAVKILKDQEDAFDIVSEKFEKFLSPGGLISFVQEYVENGVGNIRAYFGRSVKNASLNFLCNRKSRSKHLICLITDSDFLSIPHRADYKLDEERLKSKLYSAIDDLTSPGQKDALLLRSHGLLIKKLLMN